MSVNEKMTAIADAIRGKTGGTEPLTLDEMAAAISSIETGGGGSMETGELTVVSSSKPYQVSVSSKKTHFLVYPKTIEDPTHNGGRISYLLAVDGAFVLERRPASSAYFYTDAAKLPTFSDAEIVCKLNGVPFNLGDYYWFAW